MDTSPHWISVFTNETELEWCRAVSNGTLCFSREKHNKQIRAGDNMLLYNTDKKIIFGCAKISGKCCKTLLIDAYNIYSNPKFNNFEIPASKVSLFSRPLTYNEFSEILQIPQGVKTNLLQCQHLITNVRFTLWGAEHETETKIMRLLTIWISSHV